MASKFKPKVARIKKLKDLKPDARNANKHTERGSGMMESSIRNFGFGDSMTVSSDGVVLSGNQRLETLADIQMDDPIVVESDGTRPIVHVRTDLKAKDKKAIGLAISQNRVGQVNLDWDPEMLAKALKISPAIKSMFSEEEIRKATGNFSPASEQEQGSLDMKVKIVCPHCGATFERPS